MIVGHDKAGQRAKQSDRLDGRDLSACASEDSEAAERGVSLLRPSVFRMVPFFLGERRNCVDVSLKFLRGGISSNIVW